MSLLINNKTNITPKPWTKYLVSYQGKEIEAWHINRHFVSDKKVINANEVNVIKFIKNFK